MLAFDQYSIRQLDTEDLLPYFTMVERNRKRLVDFFTGTVSQTKTLDDTRLFLAEITGRAKAGTHFPYLVIDNGYGNFAGFLDLKNLGWSIPKAKIGFYMKGKKSCRVSALGN